MTDIWVALSPAPLSLAAVHDYLAGDPRHGGLAFFIGATRAEIDPELGPLARLDYQAYESMALGELERIAREGQRLFGADRIAVVHRVGSVEPGQPSVVIGVACAHRAEAFDACRWLIDTLKLRVPLWKRETFENGASRWVEPNPP